MALDAVQLIENLASGIFSSGMNLLFTWSEMIGFFGLIALLVRATFQSGPLIPGEVRYWSFLMCSTGITALHH